MSVSSGVTPLEAAARAISEHTVTASVPWDTVARAALTAAIEALPEDVLPENAGWAPRGAILLSKNELRRALLGETA